MSKKLVFDLGKSSIGWVIVDSEKGEVVDMGCRVFQKSCQRKERRSKNIIDTINSKKQIILSLLDYYNEFIQINTIKVILFCLFIITGVFLLMNLHDWQFWFGLSFTTLITLLSITNCNHK